MRYKMTAIGFAIFAMTGAALAEGSEPVFTVSGFGTVGLVQTNTDDALYTTGGQAEGATTQSNATPDSKFGVQVNAKFNDTFSATGQLFARQNLKASYGPEVEWAFVKAKVTKGLDVRAGRMGAPFFMTSDFRNVGYTNVSIRTPPDVYALVPVRSFDGADLLFQGDVGEAVVNAQVWAGTAKALAGVNAQGDINILLNKIVGVSATAEMGPVTLRAGYMKTEFGTDGGGLTGFNTLLKQLRTVGAAPGLGGLTTIANDIEIDGKAASFSGLGLVYDDGKWVLNSEYTVRKTDSLYVASTTAWYATLGYRIDKFTPYISYSDRKQDSSPTVAAPSTAGYPPPVPQTVAALVGAVNTGVLSLVAEKTIAMGLRWDFGKSYALKGEWAQVSVPAGSVGAFRNVKGGKFSTDTNVNVMSVALDFVF